MVRLGRGNDCGYAVPYVTITGECATAFGRRSVLVGDLLSEAVDGRAVLPLV